MLPLSAVAAFSLASGANAACYADYKAKQDDPLRLHYGVIELKSNACGNKRAAEAEAQKRLQAAGWTLLGVQSVFDEAGLESKKRDAGQYFLRF